MKQIYRHACLWGAVLGGFFMAGCDERPPVTESTVRYGSAVKYARRLTDPLPREIGEPYYTGMAKRVKWRETASATQRDSSKEKPTSRIFETTNPVVAKKSLAKNREVGELSAAARKKLKEELKREIISELRASGMLVVRGRGQPPGGVSVTDFGGRALPPGTPGGYGGRGYRVAMGGGGMYAQPGESRLAFLGKNPGGNVGGSVLSGTTGIVGCSIKLVQQITSHNKIFRSSIEGQEFVTVTDNRGHFAFTNLPPGSYKMKWKLPGSKGWIRRLRDKPDVTIKVGESKTIKAIQMRRGLVGKE